MTNSIAKDFRFFSLLRFAFPTIIMMVFMSLYTIIDGIFVSRLVETDALSAINIVLYGQFLFNAMYMGFSMGVAPVVSYNHGSKNTRLLQRIFRICMGFISISSMFTAFSDGKTSAIISFVRTFVLIVINILILPRILGVNGVWLSVPIAECMTLFLSLYFIWKNRHRYHYIQKRDEKTAAG